MMFLEPEHKLIRTQAEEFLLGDDSRFMVTSDYNNIVFKLQYDRDSQYISISFSCHNFKEIFPIAGQHFINKYYSKYRQEAAEPGFDLTIGFDCSAVFQPYEKTNKQMSKEEVAAVKETNQQRKKYNQEVAADLSSQIAKFKRHFYAAVYEQTFDQILAGAPPAPFKFSARPNETIWVVPDADQINVFYGVQFEDNVDRMMAKLILDEMMDAKRHVKNPPQISRTQDNEPFPKLLTQAFPDAQSQQFKNGIVCISKTTFKYKHSSSNYENVATLLQGFRQYVHYHVQASKSYLHTRVVRRINQYLKLLTTSQFDKDDIQVRTLREENKTISVQEESKSSSQRFK